MFFRGVCIHGFNYYNTDLENLLLKKNCRAENLCMVRTGKGLFFLFLLMFLPVCGAVSLEIYRPENYGAMNVIPCVLKVTDTEGNDAWESVLRLDYSWYYDMRNRRKWTHRYWRGCFTGGTILHLELKPGTYLISVSTPVDLQQGFVAEHEGEWTSNTFVYNTESRELKVIFVSPGADANGWYDGSWHVDYRAPQFYIWTKPKFS